MDSPVYYPLAPGNRWTYRQKDGSTFTNTVVSEKGDAPGTFTMVNSVLNKDQFVRKEGRTYLTDSFEPGNFQVLLRDDLDAGESWEVKFRANGLDSILAMSVKAKGTEVEVEGRTFRDVLLLEGESKVVVGGNLMPMNFFTRYYYAPGVGLVLTTTNFGDTMGLVSWEIGG